MSTDFKSNSENLISIIQTSESIESTCCDHSKSPFCSMAPSKLFDRHSVNLFAILNCQVLFSFPSLCCSSLCSSVISQLFSPFVTLLIVISLAKRFSLGDALPGFRFHVFVPDSVTAISVAPPSELFSVKRHSISTWYYPVSVARLVRGDNTSENVLSNIQMNIAMIPDSRPGHVRHVWSSEWGVIRNISHDFCRTDLPIIWCRSPLRIFNDEPTKHQVQIFRI